MLTKRPYIYFLRITKFSSVIPLVVILVLLSSCARKSTNNVIDISFCFNKNYVQGSPPKWTKNPYEGDHGLDRSGVFFVSSTVPSNSESFSYTLDDAIKDSNSGFSNFLYHVLGKTMKKTIDETNIKSLKKMYHHSRARRSMIINAARTLILSYKKRENVFYSCSEKKIYIRVGTKFDKIYPDIYSDLHHRLCFVGINISKEEAAKITDLLLKNLWDISIEYYAEMNSDLASISAPVDF